MSSEQYGRWGEGLRIYKQAMQAWLVRTLRRAQGGRGDWFENRVLAHIIGGQLASLQQSIHNGRANEGREFRIESVIEPQHMRKIVLENWSDGCGAAFGGNRQALNWLREVGDARNRWAHQPIGTEDEVRRALDSCALILEKVDSAAAEQVKQLRDGEAPPEPEPAAEPDDEPPEPLAPTLHHNLSPWRKVMPPNPDVAKGVYQQAEFAADLQQVVSNSKSVDPAYGDPKEFFRRTHITRSMQALLTNVVQRLRGNGGDPVVDLRTAFGGGKTHTLLAVLHMARHPRLRPHEKLAEIYGDAGGPPPPQTKAAVLVGTHLDPRTEARSAEETGCGPIYSLWGDMAFQLAGREGFELVREFDDPQTGGAPGGAVLDQLFELAGPSVILIDEVVAYLRNVSAVGGGAYGAHLTFFQSLTESAKRNPRVAVLVTIPESTIEFGDAQGEKIANTISNIFQRIGAAWQPLDHHEAFEVVRRRLFGNSLNTEERDRTCAAFAAMYADSADFPAETRERPYLTRLQQCYPIHPEIFDRLYLDWAGNLDRFQRTRGVLKLMADCIYRLWERNDPWPLIMPGSLPLWDRSVKQQMIGYLGDQWNSPLDGDIDGRSSEAAQLDGANMRYGQLQACRRLTRTTFLGSAPAPQQNGIEYPRILLGAVQPGESAALYGDALRSLAERLSFLYGTESRYRFETRPNMNRVAAERLAGVDLEAAYAELSERLRKDSRFRKTGAFARVHLIPQTGADVTDDQQARLVLLPPQAGYPRSGGEDNSAVEQARKLLDSRGAAPRTHRNMLAFLAADEEDIAGAVDQARHYIVWRRIAQEGQQGLLQLDKAQQQQAEASQRSHHSSVEQLLREAYKWLLLPQQQGTEPMSWKAEKLADDAEAAPAERAGRHLDRNGQLISKWSPFHLKKQLDDLLWRGEDHVPLQRVWETLTTYLYAPRLLNQQVLIDAVALGLRGNDYFGYADGVDGGKYPGLVFNEPAQAHQIQIDSASVLVRPEVAEEHKPKNGRENGPKPGPGPGPKPPKPEPMPEPKPRRFFATLELSPDRLSRDAAQAFDEIVAHIADADLKVTIEIEAESPNGFDDNVRRTVQENAKTLGFKQAEFVEK